MTSRRSGRRPCSRANAKPEGREKQFEFALNAIEPALAGQVLSQFVSTGRAPLDGSGPWIELIGNTGGPGELRRLLDGLLAATTPDGDNIEAARRREVQIQGRPAPIPAPPPRSSPPPAAA